MEKLAATRHPEDDLESEHYPKFNIVIEVFNVSGVNFSVMCLANVNMAILIPNDSDDVTDIGT